jgi:micrococcal nuclease
MFKKILFVIVVIGILFYLFQLTDQRHLPQSSIGPRPQVQGTSAPIPTVIAKPQVTNSDEKLVTRIIDGDTIEVEGGERIRYIGVDTPERGDCYSKEATEVNRRLVEGKKIILEYDVGRLDRYKRTLAYVYIENIFVNEQLLVEGVARVDTVQPNVKYVQKFLLSQNTAREAQYGLWNLNACTQEQ